MKIDYLYVLGNCYRNYKIRFKTLKMNNLYSKPISPQHSKPPLGRGTMKHIQYLLNI